MATKRKEGTMATDQDNGTAVAEVNEVATAVAGNDERLTILDAAEYLGVNVQTFRNTIKNRPEFTASGVVINEPVPGSKYHLVKISKSAIDAYKLNRESGDGIKMRDGTRKMIIKLTADQIEQFKAGTLDTKAIELVPASQRAVKVETNGAVPEAFDTDEDHGTNDLVDEDQNIFTFGVVEDKMQEVLTYNTNDDTESDVSNEYEHTSDYR